MTWNDARKLMQQENLFTARKSWVGTGFGCVYYDAIHGGRNLFDPA